MTPTADFRCKAFPIASLPTRMDRPRPGVGIGAFVLDLQRCSEAGLLKELPDHDSSSLRRRRRSIR